MVRARSISNSIRLAVAAVVLSLGAPGAVFAENAPSVRDLRQRLELIRQRSSGRVPAGVFESVAYTIDVAERVADGFAPQSEQWRREARGYLDRLAQGIDPFPEQRGRIRLRGYRSPISVHRQGYAVYLPPGYDPDRAYPMMVVLHGGSANGNLFLGVVLGNNMSWKAYREHLWDLYQPRWKPDWIVMAPDGYGQVMWRWMGEQDVLDAIDDVQRHYNVDADRVVLCGLSNGGVGAYSMGLRHAYRFAAVLAIAGAPSWLQYAGGVHREETATLRPLSGLDLAENAINTDFRYFHGRFDTGPMKPKYVREFTSRISSLGVPFRETWYDAGHDILYKVHRHGRVYEGLAGAIRNRRPPEVRLVTGDYRANRQHWLTVTRFDRHPGLARLEARASGRIVTIQTRNALALSIDLRDVPLDSAGTDAAPVAIVVDGIEAYRGPARALGHVVHLVNVDGSWKPGFPTPAADALEKRRGSSGPITDAYFDGMVHVYGTTDKTHTASLKRAAERGARGWPLWLWRHQQRVVPDSAVTDALARESHLVLYGTPGDNLVLRRIADRLPIRIEKNAVVVGDRRFSGTGIGVKFIHPNPEAPDRYVIVQAGTSLEAVAAGHRLPDFLPDYVVYDADVIRVRPRLTFSRRSRPLAMGHFDRFWCLPARDDEGAGEIPRDASGGGKRSDAGRPSPESTPPDSSVVATTSDAGDGSVEPLLPVPPAPPVPPVPVRFAAPAADPAGMAAREIADRVQTFENFRARVPGAVWVVDPTASWSIRPQARCLKALRKAGVRARLFRSPLPTPVPAPVELTGRVGGVWFRSSHEDRTMLISCELAARLPVLARVLRQQGVRGVDVMSAYRHRPRPSFHTMGLALDLYRFWTRSRVLSVLNDFQETPGHRTCQAPRPGTRGARALLAIACDLVKTRKFSTVLTPNYNEGHRDHFHIDIRPDDPRFYSR
jgi:enterochelin esterase-like enzyme